MNAGSASRLDQALATALAVLLGWGILTLWIEARWAVATVQVGLYLLAAVSLAAALWERRPIRRHWLMAPLAGAMMIGLFQLALGTTIYRWATEVAVLDWFTRFVAFGLGYQLFGAAQRRERVLRWALWFGFAITVAACLQRFTSPERIFWLLPTDVAGVMGPFVYHNQYAAYVETVLGLALVGCLRDRRWIYPVMAAVMVASVVVANSRAGTLVVGIEVLVVAVLWRLRERRSMLSAVAATAALFVLFVAAMGWQPLVAKFQRPDPLGERPNLTYATIEMALDRPTFGFGLGNWSTAYPAYARFDDGLRDNQAHNDWAQWAAEGGLPLFVLMAAMAGLLVRPALRTVWGIGLLAVLLHCLADYHFQQRPVFGYYYFALASVCAAAAKDHSDGAGEDI